jgi:hypothetical protein
MRTQVTVYLHADTKRWLQTYADRWHLKESEVVRLLVEREQQIGWLAWALGARDPAEGSTPSLTRQSDKLPPRWNQPPNVRPGRKRKESASRTPDKP